MSIRRCGALLALLCCLLPLRALGETRLMVVSDLHYLSPQLYPADGTALREMLRSGDGRLTDRGETLMAGLAATVQAEQPDALLVTGDLTFNGERASHEDLAAWFRRIEEAGTPVWVIPGNHDINTAQPVGFTDSGWYDTENVTPAEFEAIYADFLGQADPMMGCTYRAEISDECWVCMMDVAIYHPEAQAPGLLTDDHAAWLRENLASAADAGARVVTASHHNLISHSTFGESSYLMYRNNVMQDILREAGAPLHLSGHLHIQHIARADDLADAATGAFCLWPHRYGLVTVGEGGISYEARALTAEMVPEGFLDETRAWFREITVNKYQNTLAALALPEADFDAMADFAARYNMAYFSGTYNREDPAWKADPGYALWQQHGDSGFARYMLHVMEEETGDNLHWSAEKD